MNNLFRASLVSLAALTSFGVAHAAGSDTANMNVKITITATCDIHTTTPTDVDFGTVASTATNVASTGGVLTVNCTSGTPYAIGLGNGQNYLTASTTRRMINGTTNYVAYGLFSNSARTTAWNSTATVSGTGTGGSQTVPVYGTVPSANAPAGAYTDIVVATVTY
jgi:spore coat protein U-like protein